MVFFRGGYRLNIHFPSATSRVLFLQGPNGTFLSSAGSLINVLRHTTNQRHRVSTRAITLRLFSILSVRKSEGSRTGRRRSSNPGSHRAKVPRTNLRRRRVSLCQPLHSECFFVGSHTPVQLPRCHVNDRQGRGRNSDRESRRDQSSKGTSVISRRLSRGVVKGSR